MWDYYFRLVWPVAPFIQSDCRILWSSVSVEIIKCPFLHAESYQRNVTPKTTSFWLLVVCCVSHLIRLRDSLVSHKTAKNKLIIITGRWNLRLLLLFQRGQVCPEASQILEFLDDQYLWKEIIDTFVWPLSIFSFIYFLAFLSKVVRVHLVGTY